MLDAKQFHFTFHGSVTGVGFRFTAQDFARKFGLAGWVKNIAGDRVELVAQGKKTNIDLFVEALKKEFQVSKIESFEEPLGAFAAFRIE
ncbi:hypothetical protein A2276_03685 [candidate division WOR-1 bacterium RIFOXYA12_FULL_43_27]|uniref:acylphosphatase n=1 Tax=candidate division WOR-1 bacterium RIFOXYC2_FULL_46_14 TaxID=1802587 RepID=A0A1F4U767_UNCSA|nr:MAG: hypothetical protein A2276_03685 [candidate division WOR-1 bacterium RIFOXYA12_FULL_43_27]OGC19204.1 MAG: hypothetical protein A2292_00650 [candidate division WOR-1 bacterium RIFOXYB2_FULL_46_45]OGC30193.1 MAG: hypothetical protein A2232_00650 [candidate division WOR-1 bacterium RIFOXYA2_FULL_46_56]OGC40795.1 MAG: hypothetical protein A2438_00655 [candidate division WOR-1 bacterium RIFOXYC2_FULL_46_14]